MIKWFWTGNHRDILEDAPQDFATAIYNDPVLYSCSDQRSSVVTQFSWDCTAAAVSFGTGTPSTIFPCFHINFRVKSVSFSFQLQCFYRVKSVSLYWFTIFLQGQIGIHLFDLQGFYRVKPVSFVLFTRFLQGQNSLPLSIYKNFTGSNQSPFFDLQCFYGLNQSPFFDFQGFYRAQSMSWFTWCLHVIYMFLIKRFTCYLQRRYCKYV